MVELSRFEYASEAVGGRARRRGLCAQRQLAIRWSTVSISAKALIIRKEESGSRSPIG
jgi:hypothetical protein